MTRVATFAAVVALMLSLASPVFATTGAGGTGASFGDHHATHAQDMGGFTGTENPGTHQGLVGWTM